MLDRDLAILYGVTTKSFKQSIKRNIERFPKDFVFELSVIELENWRSQFVTSNADKMGLRHLPLAFTEQGVAMLSSVLRSQRAIRVNIQIIRTFSNLREFLHEHEDLKRKIEVLENQYDQQFKMIFDAIRRLTESDDVSPSEIGFKKPP